MLFPISDIDVATQTQDAGFFEWITKAAQSAQRLHNRKNPIFKLWHINGSLESFSEKQVLLSFYELDSPTPLEINIVSNNAEVLLSSNYAISRFNAAGCNNLSFCPLAFDAEHFTEVKPQLKERIEFGMFGKLEPVRKRHLKILRAWVKKYGNNQKYMLNCAIYNHFMDANEQSRQIINALEGKRYWNLNFINYMPSNNDYNKFINQNDIALAMSGGEGWGLPEFQSVALGKYCVGLNAHAYKDWMNPENSVLVEPTGKILAEDGLFFKRGAEVNQGNIFDWDEDEFIAGMEEAEKRFVTNPVNEAGLLLQKDFTYSKMVDIILATLKKYE